MRRLAPLAAAALGLAVGLACGDTLVDHRNTAVRDASAGACPDQLFCDQQCTPLDPLVSCEACGVACGAPPANARATCEPAGPNVGACGHECLPGWFADGAACVSATALAAGADFSCAVAAGAVHCWGANAEGQLGDGTTAGRATSKRATGLAGVTAIAAGASHACAASGATVRCWGRRSGWGGGAGHAATAAAVDFGNGAQAVEQIVAGAAHTCVRLASGAVRCRGETNASGGGTPALGAGATALELAAGDAFTCALVDTAGTRSVQCWGADESGQLGRGSAGSAQATPVTVPLASGLALLHVAAGARHACVATDADPGPTTCWGDNAGKQLGTFAGTLLGPTANDRVNKPLAADAPAPLGAGGTITCVVVDDSPLRPMSCWGSDEVAAGGPITPPFTPAGEENHVIGADPPGALAIGGGHACFVATDGRTRCWGHGASGQLGGGLSADASGQSAVPVQDR